MLEIQILPIVRVRKGHKSLNASPEDSDAFSFIGIQDVEDDFYPPVVADDNFRNKIEIKMAA